LVTGGTTCRRRSNSSEGEIGIAVIASPGRSCRSASSIAAANTAAEGMTPASPAPLMPSGLRGEGVSRWSMSMCSGTSVTYGIRKSMKDALTSCPFSS
jgi:hypothetical protein